MSLVICCSSDFSLRADTASLSVNLYIVNDRHLFLKITQARQLPRKHA